MAKISLDFDVSFIGNGEPLMASKEEKALFRAEPEKDVVGCQVSGELRIKESR